MASEGFMQKADELVGKSPTCLLGSVSGDGFPNIKVMYIMEREGIKSFRFVTGTSTARVPQFRSNPRACLYFLDAEGHSSLQLEGRMTIVEDQAVKDRIWQEGFTGTFPQGRTDPEYCVMEFAAERAKLYPMFEECAV